MSSTQEFEQIDINSFLDKTADDFSDQYDNNGAFTDRQKALIDQLLDYTRSNDKEHYENFMNRINDLNSIDSSVSSTRMPETAPCVYLLRLFLAKVFLLPRLILFQTLLNTRPIWERILKSFPRPLIQKLFFPCSLCSLRMYT